LFLSFILECAIRKVKDQNILELNGTQWLLVFVVDVNLLRKNIKAIKKTTEDILDTSKEVGLEVNMEKTIYLYIY
jgi:hypothetical protein